MTIQKAIEILKSEGIIYSKRGAGTFVKQNADMLSVLDNKIDVYEGVTKGFGTQGEITSDVLEFIVRFPNSVEKEKLFLSNSSAVYEIVRLRLFDKEPFILEHTIMPVEVIPGISEDVLQGSIYSYIKESLQLDIGLANRRIHADKPSKLDKMYLNCSANDPVLEVEQVVFLDSGVPFEFSKTRRRYDKGDIVMIQSNKKNRN